LLPWLLARLQRQEEFGGRACLQQTLGAAVRIFHNSPLKWAALAGYIGSIYMANWALTHVGDCSNVPCTVPVWPGVLAPAGVLWVGLTFTMRDLTQEGLGRNWTLAAILAGATLSALISPSLAAASGLAFMMSELADMLVYTPLRLRNWLLAVGLSNTVGLIVDSVAFLLLAFGSLQFLPGQIIGKFWMTVAAVIVLWFIRRKGGDANHLLERL